MKVLNKFVQEKFQRKDQHGLLNLLTLNSPVDLI